MNPPVTDPHATAAVPAADPPASGPRGRLLVVDDDRLVLATTVHGLVQAGFEVLGADNGNEAILLARQHKPELALLDIRMEGLSGLDVAEYLRDYCRIPFLFLSAFADEETRQQVRELGALDYLTKPLDLAQIIPVVESALRRARAGERGLPAAQAPAADVGASAAPSPGATSAPAVPAAAAAPSAIAPSSTAPSAATALDPVSLAVGLLMGRHHESEALARQRLQQTAVKLGLSTVAAAQRVLSAHAGWVNLGL